ncbi:Glutathione S-transferase F11 [Mycena kentingensis (nom. inval.)]|nr:Glutathione S-transferase F11 [Mycena kentingensis (nom. inval.)]
MVLKLYSTATAGGGSGFVAFVLTMKNIPFEHVLVDFPAKQHKTPEYLDKLHPFGQIPVVTNLKDDDGFILQESRAIARYLASKYTGPEHGPALIPPKDDLQAMARFEAAMSWEVMNMYPTGLKVAMETVFKTRAGLEVDLTAVAEKVAEFEAKLDGYERVLSKTKYLAGDEMTLADLVHLQLAPVFTGKIPGVPAEVMINEKRPNVARWWKEVSGNPTWAKLVEGGIKSTAV